MALLIMCNNPDCGDFFEVPDSSAGQTVRCPNCNTAQPAPLGSGGTPKPARKEQKAYPPAETIPLANVEEVTDTPHPLTPAKPIVTPPAKNISPIVLQDENEEDPADNEKIFMAEEPPKSISSKTIDNDDKQKKEEDLPELTADDSDELESIFEDDDITQTNAPQELAGGEGLISAEKVSAFIFITGYALMALGLLAGMILGWGEIGSVIMGMYIGGSAGWLGGFLVAFVIIAGQQKDASAIQCPACGHVTRDSETCGHCGLPLTTRNLHPITAGCLASGRFAIKNKATALSLIFPTILAYIVYAVPTHLLKLFDGPWKVEQYLLLTLQILVLFFVYSNWMSLLLAAVHASRGKAVVIKKAPWFWQRDGLIAGLRGLGAIIIYVLPLITIPLLPLGLLAISSRNKIRVRDLKYHINFAKAHTQEIALLWLFMLMWGSGLFLGCVIVEGIDQITHYIPHHNKSDIFVACGFLRVILYAGTIGIFSLAMFRCVGEFGQCCHYEEQKNIKSK